MLSITRDIGIDLGTANTLVYVQGRGIVIREPSVVALDRDTHRVLAVGTDAQRMVGRTPGHILAVRPLRDGVIADYAATHAMLRHFLLRAAGRMPLLRPRVMVCVPSGVTTVERRAVVECTLEAGARRTYLIEEPLAAALGAGLPIDEPRGCMVVDIGGGTSDVAVLSLGGIVTSQSLRLGGDRLDESIIRYVKREWNLLIGERTAEELKIRIGTVDPAEDRGSMEVRGRDVVTGLPKFVEVTSADACRAMQEPIAELCGMIRQVLERMPPELAADILSTGIVLTGGGALLSGLDRMLGDNLGVPVTVAEDPLSCVAKGTGLALEKLGRIDHLLQSGP
ncbi:MAG: rod shape-determining protein [Clostridia bacterium]|nr:rod shape-determining protein [Clostridia bacterium]